MFDDMITDIMNNTKFQAIIKEPFIRCRKLNYLTFDTTLPANNSLRFRKNLLDPL